MGRRLGRKRLYSLQKEGQSISGSSGGGVTGSIGDISVSRQGSELVTEIYVDLGSSKGALYQPGTANLIIGYSSSTDGVQDAGNAQLLRVTPAEHGHITTAELICLEEPEGGDRRINLSRKASVAAFSGSVAADVIVGGNLTLGSASSAVFDDDALNMQYLYLTYGAATDSADATQYTAGKVLVRLYGWAVPDDL